MIDQGTDSSTRNRMRVSAIFMRARNLTSCFSYRVAMALQCSGFETKRAIRSRRSASPSRGSGADRRGIEPV